MTHQRATRFLNAPLDRVRHALLDPQALPEWNPAFRSLNGPARAATGTRYLITVKGELSGTWEYTRIDDHDIDTTWQVPGFRETGTWHLRPHDYGTIVTHEFRHEGPLARLLSKAYRGVAELRLDRLTQRTAAAASLANADS
ncbi:SRPBCC family protein [Nonomuraea sp. CA-141351]|uniref:SRPBCC family protein n=1 Tax=Nonomuraea sp. CA-141351 TaxID=3239996 RepID=UPI003D93FF2B